MHEVASGPSLEYKGKAVILKVADHCVTISQEEFQNAVRMFSKNIRFIIYVYLCIKYSMGLLVWIYPLILNMKGAMLRHDSACNMKNLCKIQKKIIQ